MHAFMHACMYVCMHACMHSMTFIIIILLPIDMSNVLLNEWESV